MLTIKNLFNKYTILLVVFTVVTSVSMGQLPILVPVLPQINSQQNKAATSVKAVKTKAVQPQAKRMQKAAKYVVPGNDSLPAAARYARFMQVADTAIKNPELYLAIDQWIGTPYRYGRNKIKEGTDCSGFVGKVFEQLFETKLPRSAAGVAQVIDSKDKKELKEGDLIVFNYYGRRNSHVGIYLQNGWFVHASNVYGVTLANLNTSFYQQKFSKGGSVKGLVIRKEEKDDKKTLSPQSIDIYNFSKVPLLLPDVTKGMF